MLTIAMLKALPPGAIIAAGTVENSPAGIYMTDNDRGRLFTWIAVVGHGYNDWAIYLQWHGTPLNYILTNGDKIRTPAFVKKLVPCSDEVFELYRQ